MVLKIQGCAGCPAQQGSPYLKPKFRAIIYVALKGRQSSHQHGAHPHLG